MGKNKIILPFFIVLFFSASSFIQKKMNGIVTEDKWSGIITYTQTNKNKGADPANQIKTEWNYFYQSKATANITNNHVMATRSETTNDFLKTVSPFGKGLDQVEIRTKKISCEGKDSAPTELSVDINIDNSTYSILFYTPACLGYIHSTYENNILQMAGQPATNETKDMDYQGSSVNIFNQRLGTNPNVLTGHTEEKINPPGGGESVTIITWDLKKVR